MIDFKKLFGNRIGNALLRMGIRDVKGLKQYCVDNPYYSNTSAYIWRGIGDVGYSMIDDFLKKTES